ncbi:hypothetical protein HID58_046513, partial [Brassica napus]
MDDKTGKITVVGEVDVPKLGKICNAELVTVEVVKPPEKKPEPEKPTPDKPAEIVAFPVTQFNNPYQYHYSYANSYYQPCDNYRVVVEEPILGLLRAIVEYCFIIVKYDFWGD